MLLSLQRVQYHLLQQNTDRLCCSNKNLEKLKMKHSRKKWRKLKQKAQLPEDSYVAFLAEDWRYCLVTGSSISSDKNCIILGYISWTGNLFLAKMNNFNEFCYIKFVCYFSWRLNNSTDLSVSSMRAVVLIRIAFMWVDDFSWWWSLYGFSFNKTATMLLLNMDDHYKKLHKFRKDDHILQDYNITG